MASLALKKLLEIKPDLKVVMASGYASEGEIELLKRQGLHAFISKPYRKKQLLDALG